jgi:hypothetical protein
MKWTNKEYIEILMSYFAEYKGTTGKDRKKVVKKVKKEIEDSAAETGLTAPNGLSLVRFFLYFQLVRFNKVPYRKLNIGIKIINIWHHKENRPHHVCLKRLLLQLSPGHLDLLCRKRWRMRFWNE